MGGGGREQKGALVAGPLPPQLQKSSRAPDCDAKFYSCHLYKKKRWRFSIKMIVRFLTGGMFLDSMIEERGRQPDEHGQTVVQFHPLK